MKEQRLNTQNEPVALIWNCPGYFKLFSNPSLDIESTK